MLPMRRRSQTASTSSKTNMSSKGRASSSQIHLWFVAVVVSALCVMMISNVTHMKHHQELHKQPSLLHPNQETALVSPQSQAMQFSLEFAMQSAQTELENTREELRTERDKIRELYAKIETLEKSKKEGSTAEENQQVTTTMSKTSELHDLSPLCQFVTSKGESAMQVWNSHLGEILAASKHVNDVQFRLKDFTAELLHLVSHGGRLQRSISSMSQQFVQIQRIGEVAYKRYQYLLQHQEHKLRKGGGDDDPQAPRKVKILVMGGSLVVGVNCRKIVSEYQMSIQMPNRQCTWTHRLETLLNGLAGEDVFEVHKIAMGGTNTQTGSVLWENDFLPDEMKRPDIVINAYSTNDMHVLTVLEAEQSGQSLRDKVLEMTQSFYRTVLADGNCSPLVLHMDDYLGNEQREILTTMELSQAVSVLSQYYGVSSMSYANVVRDLVYGDTHESWLSPGGWWPSGSKTMEREIHPGMGMHIIASWVTAFNLLHMGLSYCEVEQTLQLGSHDYEPYGGLPDKLQGEWNIAGKPKPLPKGLRPELTPQLSLETVSEDWRKVEPSHDGVDCASHHTVPKCQFSWISGLCNSGTSANYTTHYFARATKPDAIWEVEAKNEEKIGLVASPQHKTMMIYANHQQQRRQSLGAVTIFYMKSYGDKWAGSKVAVTVQRKETAGGDTWKDIDSVELVGSHEKQTSETYTHKMQVTPTEDELRINFDLVGGTTFKLMGLAVCSK